MSLKIKIYCEDGSMTKKVKELKKDKIVKLISFPFENTNKKTLDSKKPSELTCDSTFVDASSTIKICDTLRSNKFDKIEIIIGKNNYNDIRHIDTAYKENCQMFISPDKKDIVSKGKELYKLTGIKFFYCDDDQLIYDYINKLKKINRLKL